MPKAVTYPTQSKLLERSRQHLVKFARDNGIALRLYCVRTGQSMQAMIAQLNALLLHCMMAILR